MTMFSGFSLQPHLCLQYLWMISSLLWFVLVIFETVLALVFRYTRTLPETYFSASSVPLQEIVEADKGRSESSDTLISFLKCRMPSLFRHDAGFSGVWWLPKCVCDIVSPGRALIRPCSGHAHTIYTFLSRDDDAIVYER